MYLIKQPELITGDGNPIRSLKASKVSITFNEKSPSTATMTLARREQIPMHEWIRLHTLKGMAGVFRVTGDNETLEQDQQITLKHAIDTLNDTHWPAETNFSGTVYSFLLRLLDYQPSPNWQLGDVEDENEYVRPGINYDKLSDLFWELIEKEHDYYPTFDCSSYPWTIHIRKRSAEISGELRMRRNLLKGVKITRNDKNMCNWLHMIISTQGDDGEEKEYKTYQDYDSIGKYGIIEKKEQVFAEKVSDVDAWAARYLAERNKPTISISAPAVELYAQTGEEWDEYTVGKLARVALPDYGETYIERVTSVTYPDVYGMPTYCTVNLASTPKSLSDAVRETAQTASRSAGGLSIAERDLTYWEMRVSKIKLAQDATGITEMYVTGIELDAESGARIYSVKQGFVSQRADILANSEAIELRVMKNGVISAINLTSETATIQARRIQLQGYVTASQLSATEASIREAYARDFTTITLVATSAKLNQIIFKNKIVYEKTLSVGSAASIPVLTTSASTISFNHKHTATVNSDGSVTIGGAIAI